MLYDLLANRQLYPAARPIIPVQPLERLEDLHLMMWCDSDAVVPARKKPPIGLFANRDMNMWRVIAPVVHGVAHEILK